ncbi:twin-arginine translocase subunit TatC [Streptomyces lichenis]|uniref:Sec-independent protein translocase protein TatC n=1 Tax=Streptomyces lichenis TaxID=2306967 RepID=A0ABT0IDH3_9ACTN|nr:twin-arginine translocase subunit TatC [Streptomyces lichenis]MCK8679376.1 twin-arginine translocase subunit TatC [Streptomyces lichenis]
MPLAEHLRELRNRLAKAVLAIAITSTVAAFFSQQLMEFLASPVRTCTPGSSIQENTGGRCVILAYQSVLSPFTSTVKVVLLAGLVAATPVWFYQLWAFVAPGLHRHEKRYAYYFVSAAVPLFLAGAVLAYTVMPMSIGVLISITPDVASNFLSLDDLLDFATRMVLVFGLAFELPLLLIMLNVTGLVTAKRMAGWWRGVVMGIFVFGAVATPSTDPLGMLALSVPIIALYFLAVGVAFLNDRRRRKADPDAELSDDEAAPLDLTPEPVPAVGRIPAPSALPEQADGDRAAQRQLGAGYDDVT